MRERFLGRQGLALAILSALVGGCGPDFANLLASFGGASAGQRGNVQALFINNTPYSAVLTFGTYDQTDPASAPNFRQFGLDAGGLSLDGNSSSGIGSLVCARVFSVGGARLLDLIRANRPDDELLPEATIEGVEFLEIPDDEGIEPVSQGTAPPFEALLGVDFPCNALLIVRLEVNDAGPDPFRIDFELIPSQADR